MSEAVLVLDEMPESCMECSLRNNDYCVAASVEINWGAKYKGYYPVHKRPNWCPLREKPERNYKEVHTAYQLGLKVGWNECLDAMKGNGENGTAD